MLATPKRLCIKGRSEPCSFASIREYPNNAADFLRGGDAVMQIGDYIATGTLITSMLWAGAVTLHK
jgi:hypothetical protein